MKVQRRRGKDKKRKREKMKMERSYMKEIEKVAWCF